MSSPAIAETLRGAKLSLTRRATTGTVGADADAVAREAAIEAEVLLAHTVGVNRAVLHAHPERRLTAAQDRRFQALLARRLAGEPVAYLIGYREFYGREFTVDRRVLIPRPETELLVDEAIAIARQMGKPDLRVVDVGTGSGAIAITLALELPSARVVGIDLSAGALAVALENARRHALSDRLVLLEGDLLAPVADPVDVIVANLPYISPEVFATLPTEIADHEPRLALWADDGGLGTYRRLIHQIPPHLRPGGAILVEISSEQCSHMMEIIAHEMPRANVTVRRDYSGGERVVIARK